MSRTFLRFALRDYMTVVCSTGKTQGYLTIQLLLPINPPPHAAISKVSWSKPETLLEQERVVSPSGAAHLLMKFDQH